MTDELMLFEIPKKGKRPGQKHKGRLDITPEEKNKGYNKPHPIERKPEIYREKVRDARGNIEILPGQPHDEQHIIDWEQVKEMLEAGCDLEECAARQGVSKVELKNACLQSTGKAWAEYEQESRAMLKYKLRTQIVKMSLGYYRKGADGKTYYIPPNPQVLLHAAKFILGQTEASLQDKSGDYDQYVFQDDEGNYLNPDEIPAGIINGVAIEFDEEGDVIDLDDE